MPLTRCCIVVPCYNEESRLKLFEFKKFSSENEIDFLFVNDGSTDKTLSILQKLSADVSQITCLNLEVNQGKAEAVRLGILSSVKKAQYDYVGFWDADLATPLYEIPRMLNEIHKNDEVITIIGSRIKRLGTNIQRKPLRHYFGRVFATLASLVLKLPVYDTQCGAKIFKVKQSQDAFSQKFLSRWLFDIEILFRFKKINPNKNFAIEYPLNEWVDVGGSKLRLVDFFFVIKDLIKIYLRY